MRGRLIQRFVCVLRRLDTTATSTVPGGGYDPEFGEPINVDDGSQLGAASRREQAAIRLQCQLNRDPRLGVDMMTRGGHKEQSKLEIVLFMEELENGGYLKSSGEPDINAGDRIEAIETIHGANVITFVQPPGMFVKNGELAGYGLNMLGTPKINLFILTCMPEEKGMPQ